LAIGHFENARIQSTMTEPKGAKRSRPNAPLQPAFEKTRHHRKTLNKNIRIAKKEQTSQ
jgi:hypothetical protein